MKQIYIVTGTVINKKNGNSENPIHGVHAEDEWEARNLFNDYYENKSDYTVDYNSIVCYKSLGDM